MILRFGLYQSFAKRRDKLGLGHFYKSTVFQTGSAVLWIITSKNKDGLAMIRECNNCPGALRSLCPRHVFWSAPVTVNPLLVVHRLRWNFAWRCTISPPLIYLKISHRFLKLFLSFETKTSKTQKKLCLFTWLLLFATTFSTEGTLKVQARLIFQRFKFQSFL